MSRVDGAPDYNCDDDKPYDRLHDEYRIDSNNTSPNKNNVSSDDESALSDGSAGADGDVELRPLRKQQGGDGLVKEEDGILKVPDNRTWNEKWNDFLFPPHLPRSCQLLRPENIAVPACYLLVGLLQGLSSPLINVLPLDLGASEAQQTTLSGIRSLPASFKLIFGFISDNFPILGYRRKPYMLGGWLVASLSMVALIAFTNLHGITPRGAGCFMTDAQDNLPPPSDAPTIPFLALCVLIFGMGFWLADVMGDSIVAEKAKLEPPESRGSIQSSCYSYRFFGLMAASPLSTYLYTAFGPYSVILLLAVLPLCILPTIYMLGEIHDLPIKSTREQCGEIWNTVCSRAAWQPMGFVFLYNLLQVGNAAWREFQRTVLGFTSCQLNLILIVAYVLLYLGVIAYKYFFIRYSWRSVYVWTTLLNGFFSALQVLLIYGITFGLPTFLFALGDDAFSEFIGGVQFLPTTIMMVHLCPVGSEGASYAMFTTVNNAALTLNSAISTHLLSIWDVSKEALNSGDLTGMVKLTLLTTAIQVSGVFFVGWLPHTKEGLAELASRGKSSVGGFVFLAITFLAVGYSIVVGVLNVVAPGWMGES